jgi:hypothetical protein
MDNNLLIEAMRMAAKCYPAVKVYLTPEALELMHYGPGDHDNGSPQEVHAGDSGGLPKEHLDLIGSVRIGDTSGAFGNVIGNDITLSNEAGSRTFAHEVGHIVLRNAVNEKELRRDSFDIWGKQLAKRGGVYADYEYLTSELFSRAYAKVYTGEGKIEVPLWYEHKIRDIKLKSSTHTIKTYDYMLANITRMVNQVYSNNMGGEFVDILGALIRGQMRDAYRRAYAEAGFSDALPDWLQVSLDEQITKQASFDFIYRYYTDIIDARVDQAPIAPLLIRAQMWANRYNEGYNQATMDITAKMGGRMMWTLGEAEHCTTCLGLSGVVAFASEWDLSGFRPQGSNLECGGFNCKCELVPTDRRRSPNAWDRIMSVNA